MTIRKLTNRQASESVEVDVGGQKVVVPPKSSVHVDTDSIRNMPTIRSHVTLGEDLTEIGKSKKCNLNE